MSDRPLRKCPKCSGKLEKLISRTSFALKGGGWYAEGYNKSGKSTKSEGDSKPAKTVDSSAA
jgi:predicted nucleic acid-binding Zn ribbon protein